MISWEFVDNDISYALWTTPSTSREKIALKRSFFPLLMYNIVPQFKQACFVWGKNIAFFSK